MKLAVKTNNLSKRYNGNDCVSNVDLKIQMCIRDRACSRQAATELPWKGYFFTISFSCVTSLL